MTGEALETSSSGEDGYYQRIIGYYIVKTTENSYRMKFVLVVSSPEKSHEGIYKIGIITEESFQENSEQFGSEVPGLYIVE